MCLILLGWQSHPDYPLVVAGNRDEFYSRTTRVASWWGQSVSMLSGRDEEAGGTWLGINRRGRFSMLTNVRLPSERNPHASSRGGLVVSALQAHRPAPEFAHQLRDRSSSYNGFNLIVGDLATAGPQAKSSLVYLSNRLNNTPRTLAPGLYGLSNAFLDTPWPKVTRAVSRFALQLAARVDPLALMALLADRQQAAESQLPCTGVSPEWERALSAIQIRTLGYGTRSSTVITVRRDGLVTFLERTFNTEEPSRFSDRHYEFMLDGIAQHPGGIDLEQDH